MMIQFLLLPLKMLGTWLATLLRLSKNTFPFDAGGWDSSTTFSDLSSAVSPSSFGSPSSASSPSFFSKSSLDSSLSPKINVYKNCINFSWELLWFVSKTESLTSLWIFLFRCCFLTQECWHMNLTFHRFQIIQQRRFFLGFSFCFVIGAIFFFGFFSFFFGLFFFLGFFLFAFFLVFRFTFIFFFAWRKRSLFIFRNSELYFIHLPKLKKDMTPKWDGFCLFTFKKTVADTEMKRHQANYEAKSEEGAYKHQLRKICDVIKKSNNKWLFQPIILRSVSCSVFTFGFDQSKLASEKRWKKDKHLTKWKCWAYGPNLFENWKHNSLSFLAEFIKVQTFNAPHLCVLCKNLKWSVSYI